MNSWQYPKIRDITGSLLAHYWLITGSLLVKSGSFSLVYGNGRQTSFFRPPYVFVPKLGTKLPFFSYGNGHTLSHQGDEGDEEFDVSASTHGPSTCA